MDDFYGKMAELIFDNLNGDKKSWGIIKMYDKSGTEVFDATQANRIWSDEEKIMFVFDKTKGHPPKPLVTLWTSDVTNPKKIKKFKDEFLSYNKYDFSSGILKYDGTLEPRGFKDMDIKESHNWTGTTRTSYFPIDKINVVVRHTHPWNSEQLDKAQRWRRIKQVMLFTPDGQRFRFPHNHILGARAMAQHLNQEYPMHDESGKLIQDLTKLLFDLRKIQFKCKSSKDWGLMTHVVDTRHQIRNLLKAISQSHRYTESIDRAKKWLGEWASNKFVRPSQELVAASTDLVTDVEEPQFKEARQLQEWFNSFEPKNIFENQEKREQVEIAWQASGGDIDDTFDILKTTFVSFGWKGDFEKDPKSFKEEVMKIINDIKNNS
jgi:hypothetical protein